MAVPQRAIDARCASPVKRCLTLLVIGHGREGQLQESQSQRIRSHGRQKAVLRNEFICKYGSDALDHNSSPQFCNLHRVHKLRHITRARARVSAGTGWPHEFHLCVKTCPACSIHAISRTLARRFPFRWRVGTYDIVNYRGCGGAITIESVAMQSDISSQEKKDHHLVFKKS